MKKIFLQFTILSLILSVAIFAQPKIKTFPVTPYMISHGEIDTSVYKIEYTGLKTVGVGDQVYLTTDSEGPYTWAITSAPDGSTAALDSTTSALVTFKPDLTGDYTVSLTVGGESAEVAIVAGMFVGNNRGTCKPCHSGYVNEWQGTGHSTILIRGLEGTLSAHYGESCISCHTVGYNADPVADNNGFDDVAEDVGWTFPEHPGAGEYTSMDRNLQDLSNVQCENCHGPASEHFANNFDRAKMDVSLDSWMCGKCHDDGHYHRRPTMWKESGHGRSTGASGAGRAGCADCHEGRTFVNLVDMTPGTIEADLSNPELIGCAVCHDPHDSHDDHDPMVTGDPDTSPLGSQQHHIRTLDDVTLTNGEVITRGGAGKLCMNCHKSRREAETYVDGNISSHFGPHHSTQTDVIMGTNAITFGRYIPSSTHRDVMPNFCVTCHMAETPGGRSGFGEYGRDKVGDHTFNMHWAGDDGIDGTEDDVYNVGICQDCHGPSIETFEDFVAREDYDEDGTVESARDELRGLLHEVEEHFPKDTEGNIDFGASWSPVQARALYNWATVEEDYSMGMHNYQFVVGLLKVTLEALEYGTLVKGEILNVADVPNDQGKQVHVVWSRFGGDGVSNNPVENYMVLRKDGMGLAKANVKYNSFDEVPGDISDLTPGDKIMDGHEVWTYVFQYPAAQLFEYAIIAPTLYDATPTDTTMTAFKVVGITANGITAETDEAAGFSVDNLAPVAPGGFSGMVGEGSIDLAWEEPVDEDFNYFALYKGTESGFDPANSTPLAITSAVSYTDNDIEAGKTYYYTLAAVDFAGNVSAYAPQISFVITDVTDEFGMPTEYTLSQNYPNPFNPTTEIRFGVPEQSNVKITIYNAVGKQVAVLVNKDFSAGYYTYTFDARNLSTGVYFYEMQTNTYRQTHKMLLVK